MGVGTVGTITGRGLDPAHSCNFPLLQEEAAVLAMGFDEKNFRKFMNERAAYQYQAMELIKICRRFSVTMEQTSDQHNRLQK